MGHPAMLGGAPLKVKIDGSSSYAGNVFRNYLKKQFFINIVYCGAAA